MDRHTDEGPYDGYYSPEEKRSLQIAARSQGIDAEIDAARVALIRLLATDGASQRPEILLRSIETIVRAMRVRHQISGGAAQTFLEATDRMLTELGLGAE